MRIICGYSGSKFNARARQAIAAYAPSAELIDFGTDLYAYWRAIEERWTGEDDLVVIEQDNIITADAIPSFAACPEDWCSFSYQCVMTRAGVQHVGELTTGLGCTKYSAALQRQYRLQQEVNVLWTNVDSMILEVLIAPPFNGNHACTCHPENRAGNAPHVHGSIEHLHNYWR